VVVAVAVLVVVKTHMLLLPFRRSRRATCGTAVDHGWPAA